MGEGRNKETGKEEASCVHIHCEGDQSIRALVLTGAQFKFDSLSAKKRSPNTNRTKALCSFHLDSVLGVGVGVGIGTSNVGVGEKPAEGREVWDRVKALQRSCLHLKTWLH